MRKIRYLIVLCVLLVVVLMSTVVGHTRQETVRFSVWDYSMSPEYEVVINDFQKETVIKVSVIDIAAAQYPDKMTVMLAAGEDIDLFAVKDFASYSNYLNRRYLTPLDSYIENDQIDLEPYGEALNYMRNDRDELMALPYRSDIYILYYNKDLFDQAGLSYPTGDMTWEEFGKNAAKITRGAGAGKIWGAYIHSWRSQVQCPILLTTDKTLLDGDYSFLKLAYELVLKMQNEDKSIMSLADIQTSNTHYRGLFETGRVGMLWMVTWFIGSLLHDEHDVNWGIAKAPYWPPGEPGGAIAGVSTLGINAHSRRKDAAWELAKYFCGEKGAKVFASYGVLPGLRTPEVLEVYTSAEGFPEDGKDALVSGKTTVEIPPSIYANALDKMLSEEHNLIMTGQNSLEEGLKEMERRARQIKEDF